MSKYCKQCWKLNENPLLKLCREHYYQEQLDNPKQTKIKIKRTPLKRSQKSINKVSKKRSKTLSWYSEKDMFLEIWKEREHICEICSNYIVEPSTYCFAHRCPKWTYPEHRLKKDNISLVCSIKCHWEVDKIFSWIKRQEYIAFLKKSL